MAHGFAPTSHPTDASPEQAYQKRLVEVEARRVRLDLLNARLANARLLTFLAAVGPALLSLFEKLPTWGFGAGGFFLLLYVFIASWHGRVIEAEGRARIEKELTQRGLLRLQHKWHDFPEKGERFLEAGHLYAADLDVFGQGSLFQLLDDTGTTHGEAQLARWLGKAAPPQEILSRQGAVAELSRLLPFRQALLSESRLLSQKKADPSGFVAWAERAPSLAGLAWTRPFPYVLPVLTLGLFAFVPGPFFWLGLLAHLGLIGLTRKTLQEYYAQFEGAEAGFVRFEKTFETIEKNAFEHPRLKALRQGPEGAPIPVSTRLKALGRLFSFVEVRQSGQMHGILNLFLLWDLLWVFRIEKWRQAEGSRVRGFFEALAEWEALCALATFTFEHPHHVFPKVEDGPPFLVAEQLGHPLLPAPVLNDLQLSRPGMAFMVTGSNMSGKTTWLRAIGLNAVMAQAGLPVCAKALRMSPLRVATSMRVKDSLERGVSYFYAEVQRLKLLLEAASEGRTLFLLDEVLMGTNTRERQMASKAILLLLLRKGSIGGVATHDLSLTEWQDTPDVHIENVHFRDLLVDGQMRFDYQLQSGVVGSTNALRVMRQAGIPI